MGLVLVRGLGVSYLGFGACFVLRVFGYLLLVLCCVLLKRLCLWGSFLSCFGYMWLNVTVSSQGGWLFLLLGFSFVVGLLLSIGFGCFIVDCYLFRWLELFC